MAPRTRSDKKSGSTSAKKPAAEKAAPKKAAAKKAAPKKSAAKKAAPKKSAAKKAAPKKAAPKKAAPKKATPKKAAPKKKAAAKQAKTSATKGKRPANAWMQAVAQAKANGLDQLQYTKKGASAPTTYYLWKPDATSRIPRWKSTPQN